MAMREEVSWVPSSVALTTENLTNFVNDLPVRNIDFIYFEITTDGGAALDQFEIAVKAHPDDDYKILFNAAVDFTAPTGDMKGASGDLTSLSGSSDGWFEMDVSPYQFLRVRGARAAGSDQTPTFYISGSSY